MLKNVTPLRNTCLVVLLVTAGLSLPRVTNAALPPLFPDDAKAVVARWTFDTPGENGGKQSHPRHFHRAAGPFGESSLVALTRAAEFSGPATGFPSGKEPCTISLWFRTVSAEARGVLFCYGSPIQHAARGIWLVDAKHLCFFFWGSPDDLRASISGDGVTPNQWHHVVATYDGKTAKLYYEGKLVGEKPTPNVTTGLAAPYRFAQNLNDSHCEFVGQFEETVLLDRAVTAEEVETYYRTMRAQLPPTAKPLDIEQLAANAEAAARREALASLQEMFADADFDEIVFTTRQPGRDGHWYANFGYATYHPRQTGKFQLYSDGGAMYALNVKTGKLRTILAEPDGGVRDPQVSYDGTEILFSYRKAGQPHYHLYEINVDGTGLRQLTSGPFDDIEPTYLPDGDIVFCSSRVKCNVPCYYTPVAVLYRCGANGCNIRRLSANIEHENTPWPLPDGRIIYQRWEYVDRSQVLFHHLWTTNPDGTGQTVFFGNMHGGGAYLDAKPIPNPEEIHDPKVVMIHSPGHGRTEHLGYIEIVDPSKGPDSRANVNRITPNPEWRDPYPLTLKTEPSGRQWFLAAGPGAGKMSCVSGTGEVLTLYELPQSETKANMWLQEPRPIRARPRERIIPPRVKLGEGKGSAMVQDVYIGRNMVGVKPGDIKKLLVMEILPMPVKPTRDWQQMVSFDSPNGGTFQLERVLGTVPVEEDGSAHFELPALRALFFVALDENDMSVKRMQSFMTVQPGESVGCVGCHEHGRATPPVTRVPAAARRGPSKITPIAGIPKGKVFDFPRDIQPIFDRHCVGCHGYEKTAEGGPYAGGVLLTGDRGIFYCQSYGTLRGFRQVADGSNGSGNRPPRSIGTSASPLMKKLSGDHHDVALSPDERKRIHYWIEAAGTFAGTYAALGKGFIMPRQPVVPGDLHQNRCGSCHSKNFPINKDDPRSHWLYNLDTPAKSVILLAPLAKEAGGWGLCQEKTVAKTKSPPPIFSSTQDVDYQKILGNVTQLHQQLQNNQRYDMPGFVPHPAYLGEMKRFGVLPEGYEWKGPPEEMRRIDQAYWQSLWYQPANGG